MSLWDFCSTPAMPTPQVRIMAKFFEDSESESCIFISRTCAPTSWIGCARAVSALTLQSREGLFTVPGDGCIDFSKVAEFVRTSGYNGWVVVEAEQDPAKATPQLYAQKAYKTIRELMF